MKLFVIGATGRTGREVVEQSLVRGHRATAFVRTPEKLTVRHTSLAVIKGDPLDCDGLAQAIAGHDAVVTTLGPHQPFKPSTLMHDSARTLVDAMGRAGVKRVMVLSAAAHFPGVLGRIGRAILREHMRDSLRMEGIFRASGLDWTLARPPRLTETRSTRYRERENALPLLGFFLSRRALTAFMLDALEQARYVHAIVGVAR